MKGKFVTGLVILLTFTGCTSQKRLVERPPFDIKNPNYREIIAGREESDNQLELRMEWYPEDAKEVIPDTLYFRGQKAK